VAKHFLTDLLYHLRLTAGAAEAAGLEDAQLLERFLTDRDDAAFALLLRRHGPMVLGVCQRVLSDSHECEDAFQATFLVLLRKGRSLRRRDLLANWLYGVAHRTALKARSQTARRHARQQPLTTEPQTRDQADKLTLTDLRSVLDAEVNRLPAKYRSPVVLCYFEGKTLAEAAAQLGWPAGTVSGRLARARDMMRQRLIRRDVALKSEWEAEILAAATPGLVPSSLVDSTVNSAIALAGGSATGATVTASVAVLTEGVLQAMILTKIKTLTAVVLLGFLVVGSGVFVTANVAQSRSPQSAASHTPAVSVQASGTGESQDQRAWYESKHVQPSTALDEKLVAPAVPGLNVDDAKELLNKSGQATNVKSIRLSLFEAATIEAQGRWEWFYKGQGTLDIILHSSLRVLEAEQLLTKDKTVQLRALEHHWARMQNIEMVNQARFDSGRIAVHDLAQSRFYRIQAELWLQQAKAK
jgi:RNA polymerase sigma factor (sigma-70 family)